ncbi:uncharacterized protein LOC124444595 [Xenia sp. Carnegie-2017]|uniref:uncharacterized protein LOC124444595 n=1 Tax=Xenia sp. Carnegie-2017 TaxID=2897299 RepID=UPI001F035D58|nr:uncharacterized protein LOC124444595 [Xenia sp. Carnegie-2017]
MDSINSSQLKPIPSSENERIKELNEIKMSGENAEINPRASLLYFITSSMKIQRHSKSAMILLVGGSGCGKSSTINHLLDTGDGISVIETSDNESSTKKTSEYIITIDEPKYEVSDLTMRIIDTPGLNDSEGVKQDACNFVSIKKYLETHPEFSSKTKIYPNLVFLVDRASNNRIKGVISTLSKSLRSIKMLNIVDISHPNLVVILTHVCSVGYANPKKWQERMQKMKERVSDIVFETLGVRAPTVLIENDPYDDYELEKKGEFTILPNGERQPLNLYKACLGFLTKSKDGNDITDKFGHMVFNAAFTRKKKEKPLKGHEVKAKVASKEELSEEEWKLAKDFTEAAAGGLPNSLAERAMQYISENSIKDETVKKELFGLVETMNAMGLSDDSKLKRTTISKINHCHDDIITEHGLQMLEKQFNIKCAESFFSAEFIGQGYNLLTDDFVSAQVLKLSLVDNKQFGLRIPKFAQILKTNETVDSEVHLQRNESYIKSRLSALGLNVNMAPSILKMAPEFDVNYSMEREENDSRSSTSTKILKEVRIAKINVDEFDSKKITFADEFRSAVEELPSENIENEKVMKKFINFFNKFGQFVVTSAYVGGSVECDNYNDIIELSNRDENYVGGIIGAIIVRLWAKRQTPVNTESNGVLKTRSTKWRGGHVDLQVEEKFHEWKKSVANDPVLLKHKLTLQHIHTLVGMIDKKKGNLAKQAFEKMFQIDTLDTLSLYGNDSSKANSEKKELKQEKQILLTQS